MSVSDLSDPTLDALLDYEIRISRREIGRRIGAQPYTPVHMAFGAKQFKTQSWALRIAAMDHSSLCATMMILYIFIQNTHNQNSV